MKKSSKKLLIYVLSFVLPVVVFLCCCAFLGIFPFGEKTILVSDMLVQYSTMFLFYKRLFSEGASIFYSFGAACGTPVLDMFSYYLASPFNLILLLFSEANITEAILIFVLLKFGLSGLTFSIFLIKKFHKNDISIVAFSLCYALMAYAVAYFYNVMWLDALIWLPMIILGIERIFVRKKPLLFYGSLAIAIFSNWYTGYMLCIFSGIYALYVVFRRKFNKKLLKSRMKSFFSVCGYGILAVTTCAVLLLPVFFELGNHEKTYMGEEKVNFEIFDLCSKFLIGANDFEQITSEINETFENLPALYCGIPMLLLAIMYFFNSKINKREKIAGGSVLIIGFISFYFQFFNMIWHGFNGNIWYPYRYSFLFSFFLLLIAYRCWLRIRGVNKKKFLKIIAIIGVIIVMIEKFNYSYIQRTNVVLTTSCFIAISVTFYLVLYKKYRMTAAFIGIIIFEIFVNSLLSIATYNFYSRDLWYNMLELSKNAIDSIQDDGFYRILADDDLMFNLGLVCGYNSINFSSSTSKTIVTDFLERFEGALKFYNHCMVFPNMPVRNMLMGNKYIIEFNEDYSDFQMEKQEEVLSIGFLADKEIRNFEFKEEENAFEFQNRLIQTILNKEIDCFEKVEYDERILENILLEEDNYRVLDDCATISYILTNVNDKVYMQFFDSDADIYVNGVKAEFEVYNRQIVLIEDIEGKAEVKFIMKKGEYNRKDPVFYVLNEGVFSEVYKELSHDELKLEKFSDTYLLGKIDKRSEDKVLFLSISNDPGWTVKVNGTKEKTFTISGAFMGVEVPEGSSTIELIYFPYGLKLGGIISIFSIFFVIFFQKKLK
ncbi:MAG: YfhO family protein [Clostridia bacterium]|nr:YfhO family protein [Clostridia bacterium]